MKNLADKSWNHLLIWILGGLICTVLLTYMNALQVPLHFDDQNVVLKHGTDTKHFLQVKKLRYRHLFYATFAQNYLWGHFVPYVYHLTNVAFHALTVVALFFIVYLTVLYGLLWGRSAALKIALITSVFFATHPIYSEAVTYISGRSSGQSGFFYCAGFLFFILGNLKGQSTVFQRTLLYILTLAFMGFAILSKETCITFAAMIIIYDLFFMKGPLWVARRYRIFFLYSPIPLGGVVALLKSASLMSLAKFWMAKINFWYMFAQMEISPYPLLQYFLPINLTFDYDFPTTVVVTQAGFILAVLFLLAIAFLTWKKFYLQSPILSFCVLWYFINLSPTNSVLPRTDFFSERNMYLPSVGLALFFAIVFYKACWTPTLRKPNLKPVALTALVCILLFNASLLIKRNWDYRSEIELWKDTLHKTPTKLRVYQNLAREYLIRDQFDPAFILLKKMLQMDPKYYFTRLNLGKVYTHYGQLQRAELEFREAVRLKPEEPEGHINLGSYYASKDRFREARMEYERVNLKTLNPEMRNEFILNKGKVEFHLNNFRQAEYYARTYIKNARDKEKLSPEVHLLLGQIYSRTRRLPQAIQEFKAAAKTESDIQASALNNLGIIFIRQKKFEQAIEELEKAVKINPNLLEARFNLGKLYMEFKNDRKLARYHLSAALNLTSEPGRLAVIRRHLAQTGSN